MIDLGRIGEEIKSRVEDIVQSVNVSEVRETLTRFVSFQRTSPTTGEADTALHLVAAQVSASGAAAPNAISADEREKIREGIDAVWQRANYGYGDAAVELAGQLRNKPEAYRAEFMAQLYKESPAFLVDVLRGAGGRRTYISEKQPTEADQSVIATSLGDAYDRKRLPPNFVEQMLTNDSRRFPPNNEFTANIVARSGSRDLINSYVDISLEFSKRKEPEWIQSFVLGAARAMAGDPKILQERLARMGEAGLSEFLSQIDPQRYSRSIAGYDDSYRNALATLVGGAARIQPPTAEVLNLFTAAAGSYMDRAGMDEAMAALFTAGYTTEERFANGRIREDIFHSNAEYLMLNMTKLGRGPADAANVNALTNFFQRTIFSDNPFMAGTRDDVRAAAQNAIQTVQTAIRNYPSVDARTRQIIESTFPHPKDAGETRQLLAGRLGVFADAIFEGYEAAVKEGQKREEAAREAVDLLFEIVPFGDKLKKVATKFHIPELIASKTEDAAKKALTNWIAGSDLNKPEQRAAVWNAFVGFAAELGDDYEVYANEVYDGAGRADLIGDGSNQ